MKCYSSDEPALGLKAMYAKVIVLPKSIVALRVD